MANIINRFAGPYDFLSNFATAPVTLDGVLYPTVENAYQAAKTLVVADRVVFTNCAPNYAKRIGRQLRLRPDWEQVKDDIMYDLLKQKFASGSSLASALLGTGDAYLCEGNVWHDNHFGACFCDRCLYTPHLNLLGGFLMRIREELHKEI